ncbi:MAG: AI-2E family transporter [Butyricicoccus sp.]|nr:AI-2E family transporter [Butyricicoccus sp.]
MKKFRWDKKYLYWGITAFLVVAASILFYIFLTRLDSLKVNVGALMTILSPFIWGLVIAYLLCPLMNILQRSVFTPLFAGILREKKDQKEKIFKLSRGFAVFFSIIILFILITALISLVAPRLYYSLEAIVVNSSEYLKNAYDWLDRLLVDYPEIEGIISSMFGNVSEGIVNWLKDIIMPQINSLLSDVTSGVITALKGIYNVLIGVIVSIYVMYNKELFGSHARKLIYCVFSVEAAEKILKAVDFIDEVFIGFLSGKILDSLIIGVICYFGCLVLKMPYALLVACIIGITNIIPFFGPFIGAVPSAVIILMDSSPVQCLVFVIFILVLQQFDGNILGPKILGSSVGINGFWIMFSIIVGAGLFGFAGMLLGVPVFVVLYTGFKSSVNRKLKRSGLPTEGEYYKNLDYISAETGEPVFKEEYRPRTGKKKAQAKLRAGNGKAASDPKNSAKAEGRQPEGDTPAGENAADVSEGKS